MRFKFHFGLFVYGFWFGLIWFEVVSIYFASSIIITMSSSITWFFWCSFLTNGPVLCGGDRGITTSYSTCQASTFFKSDSQMASYEVKKWTSLFAWWTTVIITSNQASTTNSADSHRLQPSTSCILPLRIWQLRPRAGHSFITPPKDDAFREMCESVERQTSCQNLSLLMNWVTQMIQPQHLTQMWQCYHSSMNF